ncbi:MAG TPA: sulfotransferase [Pseudomonadales bacterium]|nr:sulfotransferase [Pseudomonadales bacterium]
MKKDRPQRVLCVLGMHRSGTSCLTGSLQQGGLFLGKHHTWNEYNRKGNRENQDVVNLHEAVFKANGLSWKKPVPAGVDASTAPSIPVWEVQHLERGREILAEYADKALWGFKDPRTLIVLDGWHQLVPDMEFVGIYRHPMAVAQSLASRPAMPVSIEEGLNMWYMYNRELLREYQRHAFPIVCFDWSEEHFHRALDVLHAQLGLRPIPPEERFYTSELHKQSADQAADLPPHIRTLYEQLEQIAMPHE